MNTIQISTEQGRYRVYFRLGNEPGTRAYFLESSRVVTAESRQAAIASVPGGTGAEVYTWGPADPEVLDGTVR